MKPKLQTFTCVIIDDEPLAIKVLREHLDKFGDRFVTEKFTDPVEAFSFLAQHEVDLIFLDINMPGISGMDLLRSISHPPKVIFTTAYRDFAVDAFELNALDYLVKPISFQRFLKAIERFMDVAMQEKETSGAKEFMIFKENKIHHKVALKDIFYVESMDNYLKIHTKSKMIISYGNLTELEEKLGIIFLRIHRSFIVNTKYVSSYTSSEVSINEKRFPVGRSYRERARNVLQPKE